MLNEARYARLPERLAEVRERVAQAARSSGRTAGDVTIVAVTKKLGADAVLAAAACGQRDFGENYVQEALGKIEEVERAQQQAAAAAPPPRWHLLGRLQSNKAAVAAASFAVLHAVDSLSAVNAIGRAAGENAAAGPRVFVQIKLGGGEMRGGIAPEEAERFLRDAVLAAPLRFDGLMAVADPERPARPQFAALRELRDRLVACQIPGVSLTDLSAGMSGDYEDAIAEGATMVRLGTVIFGERPVA